VTEKAFALRVSLDQMHRFVLTAMRGSNLASRYNLCHGGGLSNPDLGLGLLVYSNLFRRRVSRCTYS